MWGWAKKTNRLYTWVHYLQNNADWHGLPTGYPQLFYDEFQELKSMKVWQGEMIEAEGKDIYALNNPGMSHWKLYLTMMSQWNPDYDLKAVMDEYYRLFYGPAEAQMRQFWETAFTQFKNAGDAATRNLIPEDVYTLDILEKMNEAIIAAKEAAPEGSVYARRIEMIDSEFQEGRHSLVGFLQEGKCEMEVPAIGDIAELDTLPMKRFVGYFGTPYTPMTWVVAAHDDKDLILRFYCYDEDMPGLKMDAKTPDEVWNDDLIEFFLGTDPSNDAYAVQFAISPNRMVWDARYAIGLFSPSWNSQSIRVETEMADNRWAMTVRLSLEELGYQNFKPGDQIKANFYRGQPSDDVVPDYSCWSPVFVKKNFYPSRFGVLIWK